MTPRADSGTLAAMKLLKNYVDQDVTGWLWSEKMDGVRLHWDGGSFITRSERRIDAPADIVGSMPAGVAVDCELWAGRGKWGIASSAIQTGDWSSCEVIAFDADTPGTIAERVAYLEQHLGDSVVVATYHAVTDHEHHLDGVASGGGEGIVLCDPEADYEHGKTATCLKLKPYHEADAVVVGINRRSDGRRSSVTVKIGKARQKVACAVGDVAPGDVVEVKHDGISDASGRMRHAVIVRVKPREGWRWQVVDRMIGKTATEAAEASGVTRPKLSKFINGTASLSIENFEKLVTSLGGRIVFDGLHDTDSTS